MQRGSFHKAGHVTVNKPKPICAVNNSASDMFRKLGLQYALHSLSGFGDFSKLSGHAIPVELQNNHVGALLQTSIQQQQ
jgi:hypothetical protein